jgi:hypothetical protein
MPAGSIPGFLAHYYEAIQGPFRSLSTLSPGEAERVMESIRRTGVIFASQRPPDYLAVRRELEQTIRARFVARGGQPLRITPHYMIVGTCPWLQRWYQDGREVRVLLAAFDPATVSLTYGDSFPAMRLDDGRPYRRQVYRLDELPDLIERYGLPQAWNPDGALGPERYIEAQVWADKPLQVLEWLDKGET